MKTRKIVIFATVAGFGWFSMSPAAFSVECAKTTRNYPAAATVSSTDSTPRSEWIRIAQDRKPSSCCNAEVKTCCSK